MVTDGTNTAVSGTLTSTPKTTFRIEFFDNPNATPNPNPSPAPNPGPSPEPGPNPPPTPNSTPAQGQIFLGATTVTTNGSGVASFSNVFIPGGSHFVTATATDSNGDTSAFSVGVAAVKGTVKVPPPPTTPPSPAVVVPSGGTTPPTTSSNTSNSAVTLPDGSTVDLSSLLNLLGSFTLGTVMELGPLAFTSVNFSGLPMPVSLPLFFFDDIPVLDINGSEIAFIDGQPIPLS